jgi:CHASE1-domain containing sensor protein
MNWIGLASAIIILLVSLTYAYLVLFVEIPQIQKQRRELEESTERIKEDTRRIRENTRAMEANIKAMDPAEVARELKSILETIKDDDAIHGDRRLGETGWDGLIDDVGRASSSNPGF